MSRPKLDLENVHNNRFRNQSYFLLSFFFWKIIPTYHFEQKICGLTSIYLFYQGSN